MVVAETVQIDDFAVHRLTVGRGGSARLTCFEDVGLFALAPDIKGLRCAAHFVCILFAGVFSEVFGMCVAGVALFIYARSFRFE